MTPGSKHHFEDKSTDRYITDTSKGTGNRGEAGGVVADRSRRHRAVFAAFSAARRSRTMSEASTWTMHISKSSEIHIGPIAAHETMDSA
jgi:hypothetical protein